MSVLSKELVQKIIAENDFKNPGEIISFLKEVFKDVLQEMLEVEMDVSLVRNSKMYNSSAPSSIFRKFKFSHIVEIS